MAWDALERELAAWRAAGRTATLWWRDDDAQAPSPELDRLLDLRAAVDVPLALAVIPAPAGPPLAERLADAECVTVLQHGIAHVDRSAPGEKKCELAASRPIEETGAALAAARRRLGGLFAGRARSVLVPPWNRIAAELVPELPNWGFTGLSAFGPRRTAEPAPGLLQANAHVDPVDWRGTRGFVGTDAALGTLVEHLAARRAGNTDAAEPTGLLSHHLVHDAAAWDFLEALLRRTAEHPACRWLDADAVFDGRAPLSGGRSA